MAKSFISDNASGVHPKVMDAVVDANIEHVESYGEDDLTRETLELIKQKLGAKAAYFMLNGTGTNISILDIMTSKYGAVLTYDISHVFEHETGASAKISRNQLITVPAENGKLVPQRFDKYIVYKDDYHCPRPEVISFAQISEIGSVHSLNEIKQIVDYAHQNGLKVHMDGARISNACAALGVDLKEMTADLGIDALSFGMCKNGAMFGECAVFFKEGYEDFNYYIKSNLQLQSKQRFIAAQYRAMLQDDLWLKNAQHANEIMAYLYGELKKVDPAMLIHSAPANMIFVKLPKHTIEPLQKVIPFSVEDSYNCISRLVTSFDSTKQDVDVFIAKLKEII